MTQADILEAIRELPIMERLSLIENAVQSIREDLHRPKPISQVDERHTLAQAAQALLQDYTSDKELTSFTALDGEDVHA